MNRKIIDIKEIDIYELRSLDESHVPNLIARLREEKLRYNQEIISDKISQFKSIDTAKLIFPLLWLENACLRNTAIEILSNIGDAGIPLLEQYVYDINKDIRKFVLDILKNIDSEKSNTLVLLFLKDEDENVLQTAIEIIGLKKYLPAIESLIEILNRTKSLWIFNTLINAFGMLKQEFVLNYIEKKLDNFYSNKFEMNIIINSYIKSLGNLGSYPDLEMVFHKYLDEYNIADENLLDCINGIISRHDVHFIESDMLINIKEVYQKKLKYVDAEAALFSLKIMIKLRFDFFLKDISSLIINFDGTEFFVESLFEIVAELNDLPSIFIESLLIDENYRVKDFGIRLVKYKNLSKFKNTVNEMYEN